MSAPLATCMRCAYLQRPGVILIPSGLCPSCGGIMLPASKRRASMAADRSAAVLVLALFLLLALVIAQAVSR